MENLTSSEAAVLSISCVTFNSDIQILHETLESVAGSCKVASEQKLLSQVNLYLIDNGPDANNLELLKKLKVVFQSHFTEIFIKTGQGNIGYGKGHNLAIMEAKSDYHLILNPDVIVEEKNIYTALSYLNSNPAVGLLAPDAFCSNGERQFIAKRKPELIVLLARALNMSPGWNWLQERMNYYEYRDKIPAAAPVEIELASGCYMFCKTSVLQSINGFDPRYFMYFEDFDLSIRIKQKAKIFHLPSLSIIHLGGRASSKGLKHIYYFCASLIQFLGQYYFKFQKYNH